MTHSLVLQLRFTRSEFIRALEGVSETDAKRRLEPMNCISWILGHLANQEQRYWIMRPGLPLIYPDLHALVGYGSPPTQPSLTEMRRAWTDITTSTDRYLETLDPERMQQFFTVPGKVTKVNESIVTLLLRNIYHYWYHLGEIMSIRQMLGHKDLPELIGSMAQAPYLPEES